MVAVAAFEALMPVCSYYCSECGRKITPEQARVSRVGESLDTYCPECALERDIEIGVKARRVAKRSVSGRRIARARQTRRTGPGATARSHLPLLIGVLVGAVFIGVVLTASRNDDGDGSAATVAQTAREESPPETPVTAAEPAGDGPSETAAEPALGASTPAEPPQEAPFLGNSGTKKLHRAGGCRWQTIISPENRVPFSDRREAEARGFAPCKECFEGQ